jgi:uncharacterized membrane protein YphA (DoxX/SURF4 family)
MATVSLIARIVLGAVMVVAAVSKLVERDWASTVKALRVPRPVALVVPWWELALGAALIAGLVRPWVAVAAGWTLIAFTAVLAVELSAGRSPVCACFGARSAKPVSTRTLARNGALIALAVVAVLA